VLEESLLDRVHGHHHGVDQANTRRALGNGLFLGFDGLQNRVIHGCRA